MSYYYFHNIDTNIPLSCLKIAKFMNVGTPVAKKTTKKNNTKNRKQKHASKWKTFIIFSS